MTQDELNKYEEFMTAVGFTAEELPRHMPRLKKVFDRFGMTLEDLDKGKERAEYFYDLDLEGIRKTFAIYFKELADIVLAKEEGKEQVIYTVLPVMIPDFILAADLQEPERVLARFPDFRILNTIGTLFEKDVPYLEEAEKLMLTPGAAHCACNMTRVGCLSKDLIPKPDLLLSWAQYCDEVPKVDEMLGEFFDIPIVFINRIQDEEWSLGAQNFDRQIKYHVTQLKKARKKMGELLGFEIREEFFLESLMDTMQYFLLLAKLDELVCVSDPPPLSVASLTICYGNFICGVSKENRLARMDALKTLIQELEERKAKGVGIVEKGAPRCFVYGAGSLRDPGNVRLFEDLGIALPALSMMFWSPDGDLMPALDMMDMAKFDLYDAIASMTYLSTIFGAFSGVLAILPKVIRRYNFDGAITMPHFTCRIFGNDCMMMRDTITRETGIPVFVADSDIYDARYYNSGQLRTRIEAFADLLKIRKASRA